ncbi:MAG: PKD domain-containing protein, partial [Actinomycetota bacterium]|nr:PKD domain-containing protein [Actinomycetota bacterium]
MLRRALVSGVAALVLTVPAAAARAAVTKITYPGFHNAAALDVAPNGDLWVVDSGPADEFLIRLDASGADPTVVDNVLNNPADVVTDAVGNAYLAVSGEDKVKKYAPDGTLLTSWPAGDRPTCIEVDKDGNILTAKESGTEDGRVKKWSPQGVLLDEWGAGGIDPGELGFVYGGCLVAATDGTTYVSDNQNERVSHFAADGTFLESFSTVGVNALDGVRPTAIAAFGQDELLVGSAHHGFRVGRFTRDGDRVAPLYGGTDGRGLDVRASDGVIFASGYEDVRMLDKRPTAQLAVTPSPAYDNQAVQIDASASFVELGNIERFEWDLDGDGTFELDSGADSTVEHTFGVGDRPVAVRVTGDRGDETSS